METDSALCGHRMLYAQAHNNTHCSSTVVHPHPAILLRLGPGLGGRKAPVATLRVGKPQQWASLGSSATQIRSPGGSRHLAHMACVATMLLDGAKAAGGGWPNATQCAPWASDWLWPPGGAAQYLSTPCNYKYW